jgi:hypothetical protein
MFKIPGKTRTMPSVGIDSIVIYPASMKNTTNTDYLANSNGAL